MKHYFSPVAIVVAVLLVALSVTSCQPEDPIVRSQTTDHPLDWRANQNSIVFPPTSHPYGQSYGEWGADWWQWAFTYDCASNPILDADGSLQNQGQNGPVYFLAGTTGTNVVRDVTIPQGKAVFFPIINMINDYPCPDPGFQPAPGQSLEDFLTEGAAAFIDLVDILSVTLDGNSLTNLTAYRGTSDLFLITGHPDLVNCADPCITGSPQDAVSDGYWIMLKPLSAGEHTLHFEGGVTAYGFTLDVTYNITVE